ncbi:M56 family metallopeptidase [Streptomyces sp. BH106]|uniref:M56 family metallopeptidase n=1 Tax=Streptomyces sp. BH106 TaxID=3410409 RepID=UPI003CF5141A
MIYAVWLPLLVPLLAAPVAKRVAARLAPHTAAWTLTLTAGALAFCSTLALGMLLTAGALRLAPIAALDDIKPHWLGAEAWWTIPASIMAAGALAFSAVSALRRLARQRRELRDARARTGPTAGDLYVHAHDHPYAYALPGRVGGSGTIVVSSAMLRALPADERDVLFAHERAHLSARHHLFLSAAQLTASLHPALRMLREPLEFHLERWADESAAEAVGDRQLTARAIGRAALASQASRREPHRPSLVLGATTGPVPRRVLALLSAPVDTHPRSAGRAWRVVAAALLCCLAVSGASALHAAADLHSDVEAAEMHHGGHGADADHATR